MNKIYNCAMGDDLKGLRRAFATMIILFLSLNFSFSQSISYRSATSGNWSNAATWQTSTDGVNWGSAATFPVDGNSISINIRNNHTVTVDTSIRINQAVISSGGTVIVAANKTLTVHHNASPDIDLTIQENGTLINQGTFTFLAGLPQSGIVSLQGSFINRNNVVGDHVNRFQIQSTGEYRHDRNGGTIPNGSYANGSTVRVTGVTNETPAGLNKVFSNFIWDCPNMEDFIDLNASIQTVNGNFFILNTGAGYLAYTAITGGTLNVAGDMQVDGTFLVTVEGDVTINVGGSLKLESSGSFLVSSAFGNGNVTFNINNDLIMSDGTFDFGLDTEVGNTFISLMGNYIHTGGQIMNGMESGSLLVEFQGAEQTFTFNGSGAVDDVNYTVRSGTRLTINHGNYIPGTGTLTTEANSQLVIRSLTPTGALSSNIRISNRNFNPGTIIEFNGSGTQYVGSTFPSGSVSIIVNNPNHVFLNRDLEIPSGTFLSLQSGTLVINDRSLTISSDLIINSGRIRSNNFSSITVNGTGAIVSLAFDEQTTQLGNFRLDRDVNIAFNKNMEISGLLTLNDGSLNVLNRTLRLAGTLAVNNGALITDHTSRIEILGNGALGSEIPVVNGSVLKTLLMNRQNSGTARIEGVTITDSLRLLNGSLDIFNVYLGNNAMITRVQGSIDEEVLTANDDVYNISYLGSNIVSGPEFSSNNGVVNNVICGGNVVLDANRSINGTLTLQSGTFTIGAGRTLTLNGVLTGTGSLVGGATSSLSVGGTAAVLTLPNISGGLQNLTVGRPAGVNLSANTLLTGSLILNQGDLRIGNNRRLTIRGTILGNGGNLVGGPTSDLTFGPGFSANMPGIVGGLRDLTIEKGSNAIEVIMTGPTSVVGRVFLTSGSLRSDGNLTLDLNSGLISGDGSGAIIGNITILQRVNTRRWHYFSSPLPGASFTQLTDDLNLSANYLRSYNEANGNWVNVSSSAIAEEGKGYNMFFSENVTDIDIAHTYDHNRGTIVKDVPFTSPNSFAGWNLLGNPYPSAISWQALVKDNLFNTVYIYNPATNVYEVYNGGTGISSGGMHVANDGSDCYISSMQGFFVRAMSGGGSLSFSNAVRISERNYSMLRTFPARNRLKLNVRNMGNGFSHDAFVSFNEEGSTYGLDPEFDAIVRYSEGNTPTIFTVAEDNAQLVVNSLPMDNPDLVIPVTVIPKGAGAYKITAEVVADFTDYSAIYLEDRKAGTYQDLLSQPEYSFALSANENDGSNRFYLNFIRDIITSTSKNSAAGISIKGKGNEIHLGFRNLNSNQASMSIYNLLGQEVDVLDRISTASGQYVHNYVPEQDGVYIIKVVSGDNIFSEKVFLSR